MNLNLLTPKDVGIKLGVSALTVIRLADAGKLSTVEVAKGGRRILRFRQEAIEAFITEREQRQPQTEEGATCEPS